MVEKYIKYYTDGSFNKDIKDKVHGGIVLYDGKNIIGRTHVSSTDEDLISMHNVGGELLAAWAAIISLTDNIVNGNYYSDVDKVIVDFIYDYEGVGKWINGEWKAKKRGTIWYRDKVISLIRNTHKLDLRFKWVRGHLDTQGNIEADKVAAYDLSYCKANNIPICEFGKIIS